MELLQKMRTDSALAQGVFKVNAQIHAAERPSLSVEFSDASEAMALAVEAFSIALDDIATCEQMTRTHPMELWEASPMKPVGGD
jgi:hypothetical protein